MTIELEITPRLRAMVQQCKRQGCICGQSVNGCKAEAQLCLLKHELENRLGSVDRMLKRLRTPPCTVRPDWQRPEKPEGDYHLAVHFDGDECYPHWISNTESDDYIAIEGPSAWPFVADQPRKDGPMMATERRAYIIDCRDEDHGAKIVFANRSKDVSRRSNSERCDCEFIDRSVRRAPEFDDLANVGRRLTPKDHVDRGWYWGCSGCHKEQLLAKDNPIYVGDEYVYCGIGCVQKCIDEHRDLIARGNAHESMVQLWTTARDYLESIETSEARP